MGNSHSPAWCLPVRPCCQPLPNLPTMTESPPMPLPYPSGSCMTCPLLQGEALQDAHAEIDNLAHHNRGRGDKPNKNECHVAHWQPIECRVLYSYSSHGIEFQDTRFVYKDIHAPAASKDANEVE